MKKILFPECASTKIFRSASIFSASSSGNVFQLPPSSHFQSTAGVPLFNYFPFSTQKQFRAFNACVPNASKTENSTIFRKLGNGFLSTPKVFWKLFWAFRHLRSPFWPFLCIFGSPESPRKLCREAP